LKLRARRYRILGALLILLLAAAAILWLERRAVMVALGNYLVYNQAAQPADLVLVLGGNFYGPRVLKGADLVAEGYAPVALFSGPPYQGHPQGEVAIAFLARQGYATRGLESFATNAESTIEEANALCPELRRRHAKRVLLVTSSYHSRRSAVVFRLFCPGVDFISVPSSDPEYRPSIWWMDPGSHRLFYSEWEKILGTVLVAYPKHLVGG
jgi:uncharacterized SAM-binding protein YcdF (DUF218 family)